ncbi:DUF3060 domain-containing protein [Pseudolysinimonas sp.]
MTRRVAALAGLALATVLLTGCTSAFLDGGPIAEPDPEPTASQTSAPEETAAPDPGSDYDCDDLLLNRPGNYVLGACGTITVEGSGIDLTFTSIATLVVRGDRVDLVGGELGSVEINGQGSEISVTATIDRLRLRGNGNTVLADGRIGDVVVDGNENTVTAGEGIGSTIDNGLLNEIS